LSLTDKELSCFPANAFYLCQFDLINIASDHIKQLPLYIKQICFSLSDDDLSLDCLAASIGPNSNYISVFAIDCEAKVADTINCIMPYKDQEYAYGLVFGKACF
jgi:hypothetical protein